MRAQFILPLLGLLAIFTSAALIYINTDTGAKTVKVALEYFSNEPKSEITKKESYKPAPPVPSYRNAVVKTPRAKAETITSPQQPATKEKSSQEGKQTATINNTRIGSFKQDVKLKAQEDKVVGKEKLVKKPEPKKKVDIAVEAIAEVKKNNKPATSYPPKKATPQIENKFPVKAVSNGSKTHKLCSEVGNKLGSVNTLDCLRLGLIDSGERTHKKRPLSFKHYPANTNDAVKVLLLGGIHGDEFSAVSIVFKWLNAGLPTQTENIDWLVVPVANPDGLLSKKSQRMNGNGVDLNRNFPTDEWADKAPKYWRWTGNQPRRFPGKKAASEPETQWLLSVFEEYQPDIIVQIHAPIGLIDYDGPSMPPKRLGQLKLNPLGTYPGSLGNYGGTKIRVPVLTVELESAGILPAKSEVADIWGDMVSWINKKRGNLPENYFTERNRRVLSGELLRTHAHDG